MRSMSKTGTRIGYLLEEAIWGLFLARWSNSNTNQYRRSTFTHSALCYWLFRKISAIWLVSTWFYCVYRRIRSPLLYPLSYRRLTFLLLAGPLVPSPLFANCRQYQSLGRMVGARGFEPPTPCSQSRCATRLRHAPIYQKFQSRIPACQSRPWRAGLNSKNHELWWNDYKIYILSPIKSSLKTMGYWGKMFLLTLND